MSTTLPAPVAGARLTDDYLRAMGQLAYLWGWPLVNMHNRLSMMQQVPQPGLLGGIVPAAPPGSIGMLHDYIKPEERVVACPNQDVVYGFGTLDARLGPSVVQVPDFGDRFWVYQAVDQRTDSFVRLGAMYETPPGLYLLAPDGWGGQVPDGIGGVFCFDTRIAAVIPRVFMDDTAEDRAAIQPVVNQIMVYPLEQYTGQLQTTDWSSVPSFAAGDATQGEQETQWVAPEQFFSTLPDVLDEIPPRPGEEALYAWFGSLLDAAKDSHIAEVLTRAAVDANDVLLPGSRRSRRTPQRRPRLHADARRRPTPTRPRLVVADPLQPAPLLSRQRARSLLAGDQEQTSQDRPRRIADPTRLRRATDR